MVYSIRMRASQQNAAESALSRHISGAERLVSLEDIEKTAAGMLKRAFGHSRGKADFIQITVEDLNDVGVINVPVLPIKTVDVPEKAAGFKAAIELLREAGVSETAAASGIEALHLLPSSMRGAMILCDKTGRRLDAGERGIRVSRLDAADKQQLIELLKKTGLAVSHLPEALVLATKVANAPGVTAELCWSDDPDYTTGYVASRKGYNRITRLKELGDPIGGRVFFIDGSSDIKVLRDYLERQPVFVTIPEGLNLA